MTKIELSDEEIELLVDALDSLSYEAAPPAWRRDGASCPAGDPAEDTAEEAEARAKIAAADAMIERLNAAMGKATAVPESTASGE